MKKLLFIACFILFLFSCEKEIENSSPSAPKILGNFEIQADSVGRFYVTAIDPNNDDISIRVLWGDGDTSNWTNFFKSGDTIELTHTWDIGGYYYIRAQAKDVTGDTSEWSTRYQVSVSGTFGWQRTYGDSLNECGNYIIETSDGGLLVTGYCNYVWTDKIFVYVLKTYPNGAVEQEINWIGGGLEDYGNAVAELPDGKYVIAGSGTNRNQPGGASRDAFLLILSQNLSYLRQRYYGGSMVDEGFNLLKTNDGGIILLGAKDEGGWYFTQTNTFLVKTNDMGDPIWSKSIGSYHMEYPYSIFPTGTGYLILGKIVTQEYYKNGLFILRTNQYGDSLLQKNYLDEDIVPKAMCKTSDGNYVITGYKGYTYDIFIMKIDGEGNIIWKKNYGSQKIANFITETKDFGFIVAGTTWTDTTMKDIYLLKTDLNGNLEWEKSFGGNENEEAFSVCLTRDGGYAITGYTKSFGSGQKDAFIIKTNLQGEF